MRVYIPGTNPPHFEDLTPNRPQQSYRTRAQAFEAYVRTLCSSGRRVHPVTIERARVACENDEPPWCWEEYLPDDARPPARDSAVAKAAAECIAENGGNVPGIERLWDLVQLKLPEKHVRRRQIEALGLRGTRGRPRSQN
jgi:hypothetical protein